MEPSEQKEAAELEAETGEATSTAADLAAAPLAEAIAIMARLRGPGGCPWDREQTFDSIKKHTLEETYEVFDAIERRAWPELRDELGDLLLQVLFYAQMADEAGYFTLADVAAGLNAKLIRRHPHIFASGSANESAVGSGNAQAIDSATVLRNWEQIKKAEKQSAAALLGPAPMLDESMLDEIPRSMPALLEASKLGSRAAKVGFDWPDASGLFDKLQEEIAELQAELPAVAPDTTMGGGLVATAAMEEELGDVLFTAVNLARHLKLDPESALRAANAKFRRRFAAMEQAAGGREGLEVCSADELEVLWRNVKQDEGSQTNLATANSLEGQ